MEMGGAKTESVRFGFAEPNAHPLTQGAIIGIGAAVRAFRESERRTAWLRARPPTPIAYRWPPWNGRD